MNGTAGVYWWLASMAFLAAMFVALCWIERRRGKRKQ